MKSLSAFVILGFLLLIFSFVGPSFTNTEFLLPKTSTTDSLYEISNSPCSMLEGSAAELCVEYAQEHLVSFSYRILDQVLGPFVVQEEQMSWSSCMSKDSSAEGFLRCFSAWTADRVQIPVGDQSLLSMMQRTFQNDVVIGTFFMLFVILLPLVYAVALLRFVINPDYKKYYSLKFLSSWSMLDVLALSLLITSIKGPSISIYIDIGMSGYAFVLSIIMFKTIEYLSIKTFLKIES